MRGRILAIGDIHGCAIALDVLLQSIDLQPTDTLITLGDYVDRGPDTCRVLDRLIALRQSHRLIALRGNHESMIMDARFDAAVASDWLSFGGNTTLASYGADASQEGLAAIPEAHWAFIEQQCVDYWESETHFFVHGDAYSDLRLSEQPRDILYWGRFNEAQPHQSGKTMVCGHTSQKSGLPANKGYAVCIDTWACGQGWLSCLEIATGLVRQANQAGQRRQFSLPEANR
jgi:serine/threonine protein phosphatase 1